MSQPYEERATSPMHAFRRIVVGDGQVMWVSYSAATGGDGTPHARNIRYIVGTEGNGPTKREIVQGLDDSGDKVHKEGVRRYGGAIASWGASLLVTTCAIYPHPYLTLLADAAMLGGAEYLRRKGKKKMGSARRLFARRDKLNDNLPGEYIDVTTHRIQPRISLYSRDRRRRPTPKQTR